MYQNVFGDENNNINSSNYNDKNDFFKNSESHRKIKFTKPKGTYDEMIYNPPQKLSKFYQICSFKNNVGKYNVRVFVYDEYFEIVNVYNREYKRSECKKLMSKLGTNKYKVYPVYNLSNIEYPCTTDLYDAESSLLR